MLMKEQGLHCALNALAHIWVLFFENGDAMFFIYRPLFSLKTVARNSLVRLDMVSFARFGMREKVWVEV